MFNLISLYYNKRYNNSYIYILEKKDCKIKYNKLKFGGTVYCILNK